MCDNRAALLLERLDPGGDEDVEAAWLAETERRLAELDAGTVQTIPWDRLKTHLPGMAGREIRF